VQVRTIVTSKEADNSRKGGRLSLSLPAHETGEKETTHKTDEGAGAIRDSNPLKKNGHRERRFFLPRGDKEGKNLLIIREGGVNGKCP